MIFKLRFLRCGLFFATMLMLWGCSGNKPEVLAEKSFRQEGPPEGLLKLKAAYPGHFEIVGKNYLLWNDGTLMPYAVSSPEKDFYSLINVPDLRDTMRMTYRPGREYSIPSKNEDPGRVRYEPFFKKMYGATAKEVKLHLKPVRWLPSSSKRILYVPGINGVDKKLQAVSDELDRLPDNIKKYAVNSAGTFYWRTILATSRLSPHSFGIAIDIDATLSHYWKWDYAGADFKDPALDVVYRNTIPLEIVEIFEKHGFIWGGKWYHYDTMHFEYRPELLPSGAIAADGTGSGVSGQLAE